MRLSVRTFLLDELQRLKARLSGPTEPLESVETARTVGDCIDRDSISRRLPKNWRVEREIVQFPGESLTEVVRLTDRDGYQITLKPVELCVPTGRIEIYTRASPVTSRQRRRTVDSLSEARVFAAGIAASRHRKGPKSAAA